MADIAKHSSSPIRTPLALQFASVEENREMKPIGHTLVTPDVVIPAGKKIIVRPDQQMSDRDWEILIELMRDHQIAGLNATGRLTNEALRRLSTLDFVTHIIMDGSRQITDQGLEHLKNMPQLEQLDIGCWDCTITDDGLKVLQHLPNLIDFKMCWQRGITDAGTANLRHCERLEQVNLMGTPAGDETIFALKGKSQLKNLRTGRTVTDTGLAYLQGFPVFREWQGGEPDVGMLRADAGPNHLMIDGPFTDAGLATMKELKGLFGFGIFWHSKAFTAQGIASISRLPNLGFLALEGEHCNDEAMVHIGRMPKLRMLMGQGAVAGDRGFEALSESQSLENIWGRDVTNLHSAGFKSLARIPTLRGLAVSCRNVDDEALSTLPTFPALRQITPIDVKNEGFLHIGKCQRLEALICMYCRDTTDIATEHISGLKNLTRYYNGYSQITDKSLELLSGINSLEDIELQKCEQISGSGIASLEKLPNLKRLELGAMPQVDPKRTANLAKRVAVEYWK